MNHIDKNLIDLASVLEKQAIKNNVSFEQDYIIPQKEYLLMVDAAILKNKEILAVFVYFPYQEKITIKSILNEVRYLVSSEYKYIVATNGIKIILVDTLLSKSQYVSFYDLIPKIITVPSASEITELKSQISKLLEKKTKEFIRLYSKELLSKEKFEGVQSLLKEDKILKELIFDENGHFFRLGKDITQEDNFENKLFNFLVEEVEVDESIYRYATLDTVFATINYSSIRMNGLAGMNDSSEVDYVNKYLDNSYSFLAKAEDVELINKRFISCFSTLEDSLNQWRLYGDDGKGACLTFKIINPIQKLAGIKIKKINYGTKRYGKPFHLELELIKFLTDSIRINLNQSLRFRSLNIWKHFFKPFEYTEEKEVRLLIVYNRADTIKGGTAGFKKEWNVTGNYKIIAPYITVPLNEEIMPIKLEEIKLGSKQHEKLLNKVQLELMLKEKRVTNVNVTISKIDNYR